MLIAIVNAARNLDLWLGRTFGRPYHVLLAIGILTEIVQRIREMAEKPFADASAAKMILAILLFLALLVHQAGELSEHAERRRQQGD